MKLIITVELTIPDGQPATIAAEQYAELVEQALVKLHEKGGLPNVSAVEAFEE